MNGSLDYIWQKSLVTDCHLFIDRASQELISALDTLEEEVRGELILHNLSS